jgi:hypothetical protein
MEVDGTGECPNQSSNKSQNSILMPPWVTCTGMFQAPLASLPLVCVEVESWLVGAP